MFQQNKNIYISLWLLLITILVVLMIVVGGFTRLTDSGLSITKWNLITGIFPPLKLKDWEYAFSLYKQIPEYKILNSLMTLEEFKFIFWWEYIHRLLGRFIGLFFIIPLIYFTIKKSLNSRDLLNFYLIFFLICFQGFVGWFMVKSGLSERTDVSHYLLSLHLTIAFIILIFLIMNYLKFSNFEFKNHYENLPYKLPLIFSLLILFQISIGALVSGLDAAQIYQTWPLMNQNYFPDDSSFSDLFTVHLIESPSLVQFLHRNMAYLVTFIFLIIFFIVFKNNNYIYLRKIALIILLSLILQISLGIFTLIFGAQIIFASMHQIGSILLLTSSLVLFYNNSKAF